MKKLGILAATLCVGTTVAFASTLNIPWFVDNAPIANKIPGVAKGVTGIVTLKSNRDIDLTCEIFYFTQSGISIGPGGNLSIADPNNTFTLPARASLAFRPSVLDPDTAPGGQESPAGVLVPDRPATGIGNLPDGSPGSGANDGKQNGSITIRWTGAPEDVQGTFAYYQTFIPASGDTRFQTTMSYAHLLPPGQ
ncbi:MAG: hypothetical protein L3K26_03925 [Candidatus Hydrogenedentes bacterium]|nr:hypothetical protein [Candidatus Hydrogenedentota bacterium]